MTTITATKQQQQQQHINECAAITEIATRTYHLNSISVTCSIEFHWDDEEFNLLVMLARRLLTFHHSFRFFARLEFSFAVFFFGAPAKKV